ncbi:RNA polymerase sigma factor [Rhodohalobacter sp. 614A]|uniref:RNA polymerase sigma factor n=1 Tax=Rhodohalobacter sp. 614A TaxID=2908649 RepID=UPI001F46987E|nr:sigma-70 family RNA polymerase sigma factor [Rhodohalobacter sp. 614A]
MVRASDNELVEQCLQGDNGAFNELVERYQLTMYRTALSIVKNPEVAKDVTQDGFIKSWEKLGTFDPEYKFYSWLYRIIVNEALNKVRQNQTFESISNQKTAGTTPFKQLVQKEENRQLYEAIESLSPEFSAVIFLRHFEELSYRDIAEVLEIEEKTVKSRLYGGRMKLRESLFVDR